MQPTLPAQSSQRQMFAVAVALSLAFLTVIIPTTLAATGGTILLSLLAGASALGKTDGLDPSVFATGVSLAALVLASAAAWQGVLILGALRSAAPTPPSPPPNEGGALAKSEEPSVVQDFLRRPWSTLGAWLLLIDLILVRYRIKGTIHGLDGLVTAAVLASMIWATIFVFAFCARATLTMLRRLWLSARESQFVAGMVTLGGLGLGVIGGLLLTVLSVVANHQLETHRIFITPYSRSSSAVAMERVRLNLQELSEYQKSPTPALAAAEPYPGLPVLAGNTGRRTGWAAPDSPFAQCIDKLMKPDSGEDAVKAAVQLLAWQFSLSELDARGLVFDTMVSVCQKKAGEDGKLGGYFHQSLRNAARNFRRRFWRDGKQCSLEIVPILEFEVDDGRTWDFTDPFTARHAFCSLPDLDQALIKERVVVGRSFAEIGTMYDMSENAAQKAFDRAMTRLRKLFEKN